MSDFYLDKIYKLVSMFLIMQGDMDLRISPEEKLWQAVCLMFLLDVQLDYDLMRDSYNGTRAKYKNKIREHENTLDSDHMEMVCELANVDYDAFANKIYSILEGTSRVDVRSLHLY